MTLGSDQHLAPDGTGSSICKRVGQGRDGFRLFQAESRAQFASRSFGEQSLVFLWHGHLRGDALVTGGPGRGETQGTLSSCLFLAS